MTDEFNNSNNVQRQLGVISAQLAGLKDMMTERAAQSREDMGRLDEQLRNVKQDQRGIENNVTGMSSMLALHAQHIKDLKEDVAEIKEPVKKIIAWRNKIAGITFVIMSMGAVVGIFFEVVAKWAMDRWFGK